jgi:hypothetical protein
LHREKSAHATGFAGLKIETAFRARAAQRLNVLLGNVPFLVMYRPNGASR